VAAVCGEVNAKDSLGGYTGFTRFVLEVDSGLIIMDTESKILEFRDAWFAACSNPEEDKEREEQNAAIEQIHKARKARACAVVRPATLIVMTLVILPIGSVMTDVRVGDGSNPTEAVAELQVPVFEVSPELIELTRQTEIGKAKRAFQVALADKTASTAEKCDRYAAVVVA